MRLTSNFAAAMIAAAFIIPTTAFAGKGAKSFGGNKGSSDRSEPAARYDKNHNGRIDADEAAELQKAFDADKGGSLKKYDTNHNGNLEKSEVAAIQLSVGSRPKR